VNTGDGWGKKNHELHCGAQLAGRRLPDYFRLPMRCSTISAFVAAISPLASKNQIDHGRYVDAVVKKFTQNADAEFRGHFLSVSSQESKYVGQDFYRSRRVQLIRSTA